MRATALNERSVSYRIMRLMVLFDMPVLTDDERREYVHFRNFIMDDGFMMLQYSVYTRYCANDSDADKHCKRVQDYKPKYGNIRILKITENQFASMVFVAGEKSDQEKAETDEQLLFI
jgi:CRISPR-associated protein Cas2